MKLSLFLITLSLFSSCGNPHISSPGENLDNNISPATPDPRDEGTGFPDQTTRGSTTGDSTTGGEFPDTNPGNTTTGTSTGQTTGNTTGEEPTCTSGKGEVIGFSYYYGSDAQGDQDIIPEDFLKHTKCRSLVVETFNNLEDGFTNFISNTKLESLSYELTHKTEKKHLRDGDIFLEDFFGTHNYSMEIEAPVSQNGAIGKGRGVDSHNANNKTKDALVWSFSSPVSFWGAKTVDVESGPRVPARLRVFDCNKSLLNESTVVYPDNEQGQKELHFIGVVSDKANICHISLTVGDFVGFFPWIPKATYRALAIDDFFYGK